MFADDIAAFGADHVVMATGSQPSGTGFQRQLPLQAELPGVHLPSVASVEDVLSHQARPGTRVVLIDDTGDWRGGGTAWWLAERGHEVVIVTSFPMVGHTVQRTSSDWRLRARLAELGVTWRTESVVTEWTGDGARVRRFLGGPEEFVPADSLVLATINSPVTEVLDEVLDMVDHVHPVGDAVAARLAVHAIYEGRVTGMLL
jgi:pyruvate/2-oxoglutarate dehydrogenase complex dihydrolipoamide dehydrogenase (E3) component